MTQLTFQPALDPFHAVFRILRLRPLLKQFGPLSRDVVRILDFYLLFPFRIREVRLSPAHQRYKKLSDVYKQLIPYGEQPDPPLLFARMQPMQVAALETLASRSLIDPDALKNDEVKATSLAAPQALVERASDLNREQSDLVEFLGLLVSEYELSGPNGLKARTGLMDYRYDAI